MSDVITGTLSYLADPSYWWAFAIGLGIATAISLIPGVGSVLSVGLAIPLVLIGVDDPAIGIVLLATITGTSNTFDSIPAQLMGIVSSGSQVTFLEGHQLTRQGKGAYSLGAVYAVSAIGGLVGAALLLMVIPLIRPFILSIGFGEVAVLALFGVLMVALMSHGAMIKGLAAGFFGLLLGSVGIHGFTGAQRFTFGVFDLELGLPLVAAILGVMAVPEMLDLIVSRAPIAEDNGEVSTAEVKRGFRYGLTRWKVAIRQSLIGAGVGAIPGTGGAVVTWLAYGFGIALHRGDRSEFGKGSLEGLLFAESAENAKEAGQALPTLALGVPGSTSWALVLVGMIAYGISPGPNVLSQHGEVVGLIVLTFALANVVLTVLALFVTKYLMKLVSIPYPAIGGAVIPIVVIGAYMSDTVSTTIPILVVFTLVGLVMKLYGWPRPPLVLALVLAPVIEDNIFTAISVHGLRSVLTSPLTIALFAISIATTVFLQIKMKNPAPGIGVEEFELELAEELSTVEFEGDPAGASHSLERVGPFNRLRNSLSVGFLVASGALGLSIFAIIYTLTQFPAPRSSLFPLIGATGMAICAVAQIVIELRGSGTQSTDIMDIGMRSAGEEGAGRAAGILAAISGLYLLTIWVVGLEYAGLLFALLIPVLFMHGSSRWRVTILTVGAVALFTFGIADGIFHVFWPDSLL